MKFSLAAHASVLLLCSAAAFGQDALPGNQRVEGSLIVGGATHTVRQVAILPGNCSPAASGSPGEAVIVRGDASLHYCAALNEWKQVGISHQSGGGRLSAGQGIQIVSNGETITVGVDTRRVADIGLDNTWAGHQDFSLSTLRLPSDAEVPHPNACSAATVGRIWVDTTPSGKLYVCMQPREATYLWTVFEGRVMETPPPAEGK